MHIYKSLKYPPLPPSFRHTFTSLDIYYPNSLQANHDVLNSYYYYSDDILCK